MRSGKRRSALWRASSIVLLLISACTSGAAHRVESAPTSSVARESSTTATAAAPVAATVASAGGRTLVRTLPAGGLFDGGRPPQFVLVSFDGAADPELLKHWEDVASKSPAHLSFFLSMVYLLSKETASAYHGPRHGAGQSAINFAPVKGGQVPKDFIRDVVVGLQDAQRRGHELGQHFGGHWCGATGVNTWTAADWAQELNQVDDLAVNVDANNAISPPVGAPFLGQPAGARTPCLEGKLNLLDPVLAARGYRFDASGTRRLIDWPTTSNGLWKFGFPAVTIPTVDKPLLTVDFSLWVNMADSKDVTPARAAEIESAVTQGYLAAFDSVYHGNRAPFEISNHFTHTSLDAYNHSVEKVLTTECSKPEVFCVTYSELADWLDGHAADLPKFQAGQFTALPASG